MESFETLLVAAGGMMPLSATLASAAVFDAFTGASKLEALLHGHSYAGNAIGCAVASEALDIFSSNPNMQSRAWGRHLGLGVSPEEAPGPAPAPAQERMVELWDPSLVAALSFHPQVTRVVALGMPCLSCSAMAA